MSDDGRWAALSMGEILNEIEAMVQADGTGMAGTVWVATMHYMAKCARELMSAEGCTSEQIDRVISKLTPSNSA